LGGDGRREVDIEIKRIKSIYDMIYGWICV
jgi:hypothetical protein